MSLECDERFTDFALINSVATFMCFPFSIRPLIRLGFFCLVSEVCQIGRYPKTGKGINRSLFTKFRPSPQI